jgi:hypothetical protein
MSGYSDLRLDPNAYLGLSYNTYKNRLYKTALVNPEQYYDLREKIEKILQTSAIGALYDTIFYALKDGKQHNGNTSLGLPLAPNVPVSKINQICMDACETLNEIITKEVLELLLPIDYNILLASRLKDKGQAKALADLTP